MSFAIDPRLVGVTHPLGDLGLSRLLLMDDARFPWLVLVPRIAGARELFDLDGADRASLLAELDVVGRALEALLAPDKFNIAALGNVVPQLHVHVIARWATDVAWPKPVWNHGDRMPYEPAALAERIAALRGALPTLA